MNNTAINPYLNDNENNHEHGQETVINPVLLSEHSKLPVGTIIDGKYKVEKPLPLKKQTGEAELYICSYNGNEYVAKIYRRQTAIKPEIINVLKSLDSPYIAKLYDAGIYRNLPYTILPYYKNGSLEGRTYSLEELKTTIIPCINNGLKILHDNNILHKDLKPSNIMLTNDGTSVSIIDFGISSFLENGETVLSTKTGMSPQYSAPETFKNLFLKESDYYSFGMTILELFCGNLPYADMNEDEIIALNTVQSIPIPQNVPQNIHDLISALTYIDISNRNDEKNPNRRWTYKEVKKWCNDEKQTIPGKGFVPMNATPAYTFLGQSYHDISSLSIALASNWNEGKKQLYRGLLSGFFKNFNPEIAGFCIDAETASNSAKGKEDFIFWNLLYKINPELNVFCWMGKIYDSLCALGQDMLERLWRNDESMYEYWDSIFEHKLLTNYLSKINSTNNLVQAVSALETTHRINRSGRDIHINYYTTAYLLSGKKIFNKSGMQFTCLSDLTTYMNTLLDSSYEEFEAFCRKIIDHNSTLDTQFEAWLIALGKRKELDEWKRKLNL